MRGPRWSVHREVDPLAVGRKPGERRVAQVRRQLPRPAATRGHDEQAAGPVDGVVEDDHVAARRPPRKSESRDQHLRGELHRVRAVSVRDPDLHVACNDRTRRPAAARPATDWRCCRFSWRRLAGTGTEEAAAPGAGMSMRQTLVSTTPRVYASRCLPSAVRETGHVIAVLDGRHPDWRAPLQRIQPPQRALAREQDLPPRPSGIHTGLPPLNAPVRRDGFARRHPLPKRPR